MKYHISEPQRSRIRIGNNRNNIPHVIRHQSDLTCRILKPTQLRFLTMLNKDKPAFKAVGKTSQIPVWILPEQFTGVKNFPYKSRCKRCHRRIKIRTEGQVYGPVCFKRVMREDWEIDPSQMRLDSYVEGY